MQLKSIFLLILIMITYLIESMFIGLFVNIAWKFVLQSQFEVQLTYKHWVLIIWIVKILLFDVFKVVAAMEKIKEEKELEIETETKES